MSTPVQDTIKSRLKASNLDERYKNGQQPYTNTLEAKSIIFGTDIIVAKDVGLTILVKETDWLQAKEFWIQPVDGGYDFVEKGVGTTDYNDLENKPTISDGGQGSAQIPLTGNVKVTATAATSGQTTGVTVTAENGGITMAFTLEKGADGVNGNKGIDGKSAYQQWLDEGNTGDETDFLNSLKAQIGKFIYAGYNATAAALSIGGATTEALATGATNDSIVLMPNNDATAGTGNPTATMMFSVSVSDDPTPVTTYTYIGDVHVDASTFIGTDKIVQDLRAGGTGNVPSAEAVKTIVETTMELVEPLNMLNPADIKIGKRIASNGDEYNTSSTAAPTPKIYGCTDYIEIGDGVICNKSLNRIGIYRGAAVYDADRSFIGTKSTQTDGGELLITKDMTGWGDTAATGADTEHPYYVRFNLYNPASAEGGVAYDGVTDGYAVYRATELPTPAFQPYHAPYWKQKAAPIQDGAVTTEKIADSAVTPAKVSFFKNVIVSGNILNPATIKPGTMVKRSDGKETNSNSLYCTDFIPIDERGLYINHSYNAQGTWGCGCVYYAEDKSTFIGYIYASGSGDELVCGYIDGAAYVRFNIPNGNPIETVYVCRGTQKLPDGYEPYEEQYCVDPKYVLAKGLVTAKEIVEAAKEAGINSDSIDISLPNRFYAVVGDTLQLFYHGMVIVPDLRFYDIHAKDTAIGKGLGRYFEGTPELNEKTGLPPGNTNFSLEVYDQNMRLLGQKTCEIVAVDKPTSPINPQNILVIGDSLTAGGGWIAELRRRLTANDGTPQGLGLTNINFVGHMSNSKDGGTSHFYARSGWGWVDFATKGRPAFRLHISATDAENISLYNEYNHNGHTYKITEKNNLGAGTATDDWTVLAETGKWDYIPLSSGTLTPKSNDATYPSFNFTSYETEEANRFWDEANQKIDIKRYCTTYANMSTEDNLDYVLILLGSNLSPDTENIEDWSAIITQIYTVLDAIHTAYPTCKVKLMGHHFLYIPTYVGDKNDQHTFMLNRKYAFMNKLYQDICNKQEYSDYVEFVNISAQLDSEYNMDLISSSGVTREKNVNTRNSHFKEVYTGNGVHPGTNGYMQIADAAYRVMCAALQGEDN